LFNTKATARPRPCVEVHHHFTERMDASPGPPRLTVGAVPPWEVIATEFHVDALVRSFFAEEFDTVLSVNVELLPLKTNWGRDLKAAT
jgi:hypothetical protein